MKLTVKRPVEIEVSTVHLLIPGDARDPDGELPEEECVMMNDAGDVEMTIDIDAGRILNWRGRAMKFSAWPKDSGSYTLYSPSGEKIAFRDDYVPHGLIPGSYGDSIELDVDVDGRIKNWPKRPDLSAFFDEDED